VESSGDEDQHVAMDKEFESVIAKKAGRDQLTVRNLVRRVKEGERPIVSFGELIVKARATNNDSPVY